jgi:hypothetical protein
LGRLPIPAILSVVESNAVENGLASHHSELPTPVVPHATIPVLDELNEDNAREQPVVEQVVVLRHHCSMLTNRLGVVIEGGDEVEQGHQSVHE